MFRQSVMLRRSYIDRRYKSGRKGRLPRRLTGEKPESLGALVLPTALHGEAAGFEEGEEAVGEFALEFEGATFKLAAAAERGFQFVEKVFEFRCRPCGGKPFEDEDGLAAAVGGGAAEEKALLRFFFRRGLSSRRICRRVA